MIQHSVLHYKIETGDSQNTNGLDPRMRCKMLGVRTAKRCSDTLLYSMSSSIPIETILVGVRNSKALKNYSKFRTIKRKGLCFIRAATDLENPDLLTTRIENSKYGSVKKTSFINLVQHYGRLKFVPKILTNFPV